MGFGDDIQSLSMTISVLLADDSEIIRKAITKLFKADPEFRVVGEAVSFNQTLHLTSALHPQVVVMDLYMKDDKGVEPSEVKSCLVGSQMLAISLRKDAPARTLAESYGAVRLLDRMYLSTELIPAIKQIVQAPIR